MKRSQQEIAPIDSVRFNSDFPVFQAPPARQANYQGVQPVDGISLSRESKGYLEEDRSEDVCQNFLAAWG